MLRNDAWRGSAVMAIAPTAAARSHTALTRRVSVHRRSRPLNPRDAHQITAASSAPSTTVTGESAKTIPAKTAAAVAGAVIA